MKKHRELIRSKKELKEGREGGREAGKIEKVGKKGRMSMFLNFVILRP